MIQIVRFEDLLLYGITTTTNVPISSHESHDDGTNDDAEYQEGTGDDAIDHQNRNKEDSEAFEENHYGESHGREEANEHLFVGS